MPSPLEYLQAIARAIDNVQRDSDLNEQQQTFVNHIQKIASELQRAIEPIPPTELALITILPSFGDAFLQQQAALFGYAKMLLDHPQSFDDAILSEYQRDQMQIVYQQGQALHTLTNQIYKTAHSERKTQHQATPQIINVLVFLIEQIPILNYYCAHLAYTGTHDSSDMLALATPYHLAAFIQHIIRVLAQDIDGVEQIEIGIEAIEETIAIVINSIDSTLTDEDYKTIFVTQGRYLYQQRFQKEGGRIQIRRDTNDTHIQLRLPFI